MKGGLRAGLRFSRSGKGRRNHSAGPDRGKEGVQLRRFFVGRFKNIWRKNEADSEEYREIRQPEAEIKTATYPLEKFFA
jgi:hypothetical protein